MPEPIVLYHADCNDGLAAAWAVRHRHPAAECVPVKHGTPPPDVAGRTVIIVDFSYPRETLLKMLDVCESMSIFDHHKTAQEALVGLEHPRLTRLVFDMERSGAGIAWDEFGHPLLNPGGPVIFPKRPRIIDFIEDNDLGRTFTGTSKHPEETRAVVEALRAQPRTMASLDIMRAACDDPLLFKMVCGLGEGIIRYKDQMVAQAEHFAQEVTLAGHRVFAANVPYFLSSETAHALIRDRAFGVTYFWDGERGLYNFSLRSRDDREDVSSIARALGGGGHRNASGFTAKRLPWTEGGA